MSTNILESRVTYLDSVRTPKNFSDTSLQQALDQIKDPAYAPIFGELRSLYIIGDNVGYKELKSQLPVFCFHGTFEGSVTNTGFAASSGLFSLDIDGIASIEELAHTLDLLKKDPYVVFAFISPSGMGVKSAMRVDPLIMTGDAAFKQGFSQIEEYWEYKGVTLDPACKDIRRFSFISYDPELYCNPAAKCFPLMMDAPQESTTETIPDDFVQYGLDEDAELVRSALKCVTDYSYGSWIKVAAALSYKFGEAGFEIFHEWSERDAGYDCEEDCQRKYTTFKHSTAKPVKLGTIFNMAKDNGWVKPSMRQDTYFVTDRNVKNAAEVHEWVVNDICGVLKDNNIAFDREKVKEAIFTTPIANCLSSAFWNDSKSRVFMFAQNGDGESLSGCLEKDFKDLSNAVFGNMYDGRILDSLLGAAATPVLKKKLRNVTHRRVLLMLKLTQKNSMTIKVDMFAERGRMELLDEDVRVIFKHEPFPEGPINSEVVSDFKEHFPEFEDILDLIVNARFAADRKKAYLWLHAPSNWGKGLLLGALSNLNACVGLTVKETESLFEGKPVGKSPKDFKRALVTAFDEFKTVKSELKQLQSEIELSPKNQLCCKVEVFTKLFLSAESVESLVGSHGVEDQFCTRMSMIRGEGIIDDRPLFTKLGNAAYCESLTNYMAVTFNRKIESLIALGRFAAEKRAGERLTTFHNKYGIANTYGTLSSRIEALSSELIDSVLYDLAYNTKVEARDYAAVYKDQLVLRKSSKIIDDYIDKHVAQSERAMLRMKKADIKRLWSADGTGKTRTFRCETGKIVEGILLQRQDKIALTIVATLNRFTG